MKLWVDDIRPAPEGWHWARTVTEAIRVLDEQAVSVVSIDHDISMKVSVGYGDPRPFASPETFEPVARFIRNMDNPPGGVYLHSANPAGRSRMMEIVRRSKHHFVVEERPSKPCNRFEETGS